MDYKDKIFIFIIENKFRTKDFDYIGYVENLDSSNGETIYNVRFNLTYDDYETISKNIMVRNKLFKELSRNYSLKTLTDDSES